VRRPRSTVRQAQMHFVSYRPKAPAMKTNVIERIGKSVSLASMGGALVVFTTADPLAAQDATGDSPPPVASEVVGVEGGAVYLPADFARFAPRSALDMLKNVPGF